MFQSYKRLGIEKLGEGRYNKPLCEMTSLICDWQLSVLKYLLMCQNIILI